VPQCAITGETVNRLHQTGSKAAPALGALHYWMYIHLRPETVNFRHYWKKEQEMAEQTAVAQLAAAMGDEPAPIYQRVK